MTAKFKGYSKPFKVLPYDGGEELTFKDENFEILESHKGNLDEGKIIRVRSLADENVEQEDVKIYFTESNDYIMLFLTRPTSDSHKTDEDYYIAVSGPLGIFNLVDDQLVNIIDSSISYNKSYLDKIDSSIDPFELELNQMQENLNNGSITQEEYDLYIDSLDQYGEKVE